MHSGAAFSELYFPTETAIIWSSFFVLVRICSTFVKLLLLHSTLEASLAFNAQNTLSVFQYCLKFSMFRTDIYVYLFIRFMYFSSKYYNALQSYG